MGKPRRRSNRKSSSSKKGFQLYFAGKMADLDEEELFFQSFFKLSPEVKIRETWALTELAVKLKGKDPNELRLDRTTLILKRI